MGAEPFPGTLLSFGNQFSMLDYLVPHLDIKGGAWLCLNLMGHTLCKPMGGACPFVKGGERGADRKEGRWERGVHRRKGGRENWLTCKMNEKKVIKNRTFQKEAVCKHSYINLVCKPWPKMLATKYGKFRDILPLPFPLSTHTHFLLSLPLRNNTNGMLKVFIPVKLKTTILTHNERKTYWTHIFDTMCMYCRGQ